MAEGPAQPEQDRAAFIERVRRSGIKIDRQGRFIHEGAAVEHLGLKSALFRWLDRLPPPDGRYILRLDAQRFAYLEVEDTPLVATSLRFSGDQAGHQSGQHDGDQAYLGLQDGSEEPLSPQTLTVDQEGVLRCQVRPAGLEVRLSTSAAATLAERIEGSGGALVLRLGGRRTSIPARARAPV